MEETIETPETTEYLEADTHVSINTGAVTEVIVKAALAAVVTIAVQALWMKTQAKLEARKAAKAEKAKTLTNLS